MVSRANLIKKQEEERKKKALQQAIKAAQKAASAKTSTGGNKKTTSSVTTRGGRSKKATANLPKASAKKPTSTVQKTKTDKNWKKGKSGQYINYRKRKVAEDVTRDYYNKIKEKHPTMDDTTIYNYLRKLNYGNNYKIETDAQGAASANRELDAMETQHLRNQQILRDIATGKIDINTAEGQAQQRAAMLTDAGLTGKLNGAGTSKDIAKLVAGDSDANDYLREEAEKRATEQYQFGEAAKAGLVSGAANISKAIVGGGHKATMQYLSSLGKEWGLDKMAGLYDKYYDENGYSKEDGFVSDLYNKAKAQEDYYSPRFDEALRGIDNGVARTVAMIPNMMPQMSVDMLLTALSGGTNKVAQTGKLLNNKTLMENAGKALKELLKNPATAFRTQLYYQNAVEQNMANGMSYEDASKQAMLYAPLAALVESGGVQQAVGKIGKKATGGFAKNLAKTAIGEGVEEVAQLGIEDSALGAVGEDVELDLKKYGQALGVGTVLGGVMGAPVHAIQSINNRQYEAMVKAMKDSAQTQQTKRVVQNVADALDQMEQEAVAEVQGEVAQVAQNPVSTINNVNVEEGVEKEDASLVGGEPGQNPVSTSDSSDTSSDNSIPQSPQNNNQNRSKFAESIEEKQNIYSDEFKELAKEEPDIQYYQGITNKDTLDRAYQRLQTEGKDAVERIKSDGVKSAEDVALGFIAMKHFDEQGNYAEMISIAKKLRESATAGGRLIQAFSIMSRMTPEGMVKYAISELDGALDVLSKGKSAEYTNKLREKLQLSEAEVKEIIDRMKIVQSLPDGRDKNIQLAYIAKIIKNKIPPSLSRSIKAYARVNMLLNPKTHVRNVVGNSFIVPVNAVADWFASGMDKYASKRYGTGERTIGASMKGYLGGAKQGAFESWDDFVKGINTRNVSGDRFEIGEGKNFTENTAFGKALNKLDRVNSFLLDAGDRTFYQAEFIKSLNNQMRLNGTDTPTASMIEVATQTALQRTWQDNNTFTEMGTRLVGCLNKFLGSGEYGLGSMIVPFVKTPANLTKAIVDYSPLGVVNALVGDARKLKNAAEKGEDTTMLQHKFANDFGKGMAGTLMTIIGMGIAGALENAYGENFEITGSSDPDKDVANFEKYVLGIQPYSVKIGEKSFTYNWAMPIGGTMAVTSDVMKALKNKDENALQKSFDIILSALSEGVGVLAEQSYIQGLTEFFGEDNIMQAVFNAPRDAITQFVPLSTFVGQVASFVDDTKRVTYGNDGYLGTAKNLVKNRMPGLKDDLPVSYNVMGEEIKMYGGNEEGVDWYAIRNFLSPSNVSKSTANEAAKEIYRVYKLTGDKTIFPRVADNKITKNGETIKLSNAEKSDLQRIMGQKASKDINSMISKDWYKDLPVEEQNALLKAVADFSVSYAKQTKYSAYDKDSTEYRNIEKAKKMEAVGIDYGTYYYCKTNITKIKEEGSEDKKNVINWFRGNKTLTNKQKNALWECIKGNWKGSWN